MAHLPPTPLPFQRVYLQRSVLEPCFSNDGKHLLFAMMSDGRTAVHRLRLSDGFQEVLTSEPVPAGGITYGGGLFALSDRFLIFPTREGRLWRLDLTSGAQVPLTPALEAVGAPIFSPCGRFVACAAETDSSGFVLLTTVQGDALPLRLPESLAFAADPCFGPRGEYCAWHTWPDNQMPWEHAELRIARFARPLSDCHSLLEALPVQVSRLVRPGVHLSFPLPHPDGKRLLFTSDETGWRAPWFLDLETGQTRLVSELQGEVGGPNWVLRIAPFALGQGGSRLYVISKLSSASHLSAIDLDSGTMHPLPSRSQCLSSLACFDGGRGGTDLLAYLASDPVTPAMLVTREVDASNQGCVEIDRVPTAIGVWDSTQLSRASTLSWRASDGTEVWGVWTPAQCDGRAPAIVCIHGGPTAAAELNYDATAQFYASRGYHFLAVNHRGSTQRGRAYQDLLLGRWGVVDVEDARGGAQALVDRGVADPERVALFGGSAGGFTTLSALALQPDFWAAGISLYGIGDLYEAMLGSHRFEKHYEESLVGRLPETGRLWVERSPLTHATKVRAPLLLFHGLQDKAVPARQSIEFAEALRSRHGQVELVTYDEEGHGFRREKNRKEVLERCLAFLDKYVKNRQGQR